MKRIFAVMVVLLLAGCEGVVSPGGVVVGTTDSGGVSTDPTSLDPPLGPWACTEVNTSTNRVSYAWGSSQGQAAVNADQDCRQGPDGFFCGVADCESVSEPVQMWRCRVVDRRSDRVFIGYGDLKVQAKFRAQNDCVADGDLNAFFCLSDDNLDCTTL